MHLTPRGAAEFSLVAIAVTLAEPTLRSMLVGGAVSVLGLAVRVWTAGFRAAVPTAALTPPPRHGPYRFVRHPYLFGSALLFAGLGLATANLYAAATIVLVLPVAFRSAFVRGEALQAAALGPWYPAYAVEVPALLPRLFPAAPPRATGRPAVRPRFSVEYAVLRGHHRELNALLVTLGTGALFYLLHRLHPAPQDQRLGSLCAVFLLSAGRFVYYATARRPVRSSLRLNQPQ